MNTKQPATSADIDKQKPYRVWCLGNQDEEGPDPSQIAAACVPVFKAACSRVSGMDVLDGDDRSEQP